MASRLTAAMEEAYASAPSNVVFLHTLEFYHPTWGYVRIVTGDEGLEPAEVVSLTLETGATADFVSMAFDVLPPGTDHEGPTEGRVRVDGVSGTLFSWFEAVSAASGTISVTYRVYRSDVRFEPGEVISGLRMRQVTMTATVIEGTLAFEEVASQHFPRATYTIEEYPGLYQV